MVKFNKKQIEFLQRFESYMKTAKSDYVRAIGWQDAQDICNLWNEVSGEGFELERGCGACTLELFKKVGKVYFAQTEAEDVRKAKARAKSAIDGEQAEEEE